MLVADAPEEELLGGEDGGVAAAPEDLGKWKSRPGGRIGYSSTLLCRWREAARARVRTHQSARERIEPEQDSGGAAFISVMPRQPAEWQ